MLLLHALQQHTVGATRLVRDESELCAKNLRLYCCCPGRTCSPSRGRSLLTEDRGSSGECEGPHSREVDSAPPAMGGVLTGCRLSGGRPLVKRDPTGVPGYAPNARGGTAR